MEIKKPLDVGDTVPNFCLKGIDPEGKEIDFCFDQVRDKKVISKLCLTQKPL
ncbi:MAG: hypothetical protein ABGX24_00215 [Aquificota bacterium]